MFWSLKRKDVLLASSHTHAALHSAGRWARLGIGKTAAAGTLDRAAHVACIACIETSSSDTEEGATVDLRLSKDRVMSAKSGITALELFPFCLGNFFAVERSKLDPVRVC